MLCFCGCSSQHILAQLSTRLAREAVDTDRTQLAYKYEVMLKQKNAQIAQFQRDLDTLLEGLGRLDRAERSAAPSAASRVALAEGGAGASSPSKRRSAAAERVPVSMSLPDDLAAELWALEHADS